MRKWGFLSQITDKFLGDICQFYYLMVLYSLFVVIKIYRNWIHRITYLNELYQRIIKEIRGDGYNVEMWIELIPMMHGYFKMGNIPGRIVSDISLFMCKIRVLSVSTTFPCRIHDVSVHHRLVQGFDDDE